MQLFSSVSALMSLSFRPLRSLVKLNSLRTVGPIHLNHPGIIAPLSPMLTCHAIGTVETTKFPASISPAVLSAIHLPIFSTIGLPVFLTHITDMAHTMVVSTALPAMVPATARSTID